MVGALIGFVAIIWLLRGDVAGQGTEGQVSEIPAAINGDAMRTVVLLLDDDHVSPVSIWQIQYAAESQAYVACVVPVDTVLQPSGMSASEIVRKAIQTGDLAWLSKNVRPFGAGCGFLEQNADPIVLMLDRLAFSETVDDLGGIEIGGQWFDGQSAWQSLLMVGEVGIDMHRQVWSALGTRRTAAVDDICLSFSAGAPNAVVYPQALSACSVWQDVLLHAPQRIFIP